MKEIKLSQGLYTTVDDEDYNELIKYKWFAHKSGNTFYAERHDYLNGKRVIMSMHRFIIKNNSKLHTDHINGNGLDNRKENLRIVTNRQNQHNQQNRHKAMSSKYAGVYFEKCSNKWKAQIGINNKQISIGRFDTELDAYNAYLNKLQEIGESVINNVK